MKHHPSSNINASQLGQPIGTTNIKACQLGQCDRITNFVFLSCGGHEIHQDNLNWLTRIKVFINLDQVQQRGYNMDLHPINPMLSLTIKPFYNVVVKTSKKSRHKCMKMSGYRINGSSDLFLLVHIKSVNIDSYPTQRLL